MGFTPSPGTTGIMRGLEDLLEHFKNLVFTQKVLICSLVHSQTNFFTSRLIRTDRDQQIFPLFLIAVFLISMSYSKKLNKFPNSN